MLGPPLGRADLNDGAHGLYPGKKTDRWNCPLPVNTLILPYLIPELEPALNCKTRIGGG
jgi:hypothetical protein